MTTIEELQSSMDGLVSFAEGENRPLSDEEVTKWEGFKKDLLAIQKTDQIKAENAAWSAPRVTVLSPVGKHITSRDSQAFAMDRYIRGDMAAGKELTSHEDGGKVISLSASTEDVQKFAQTETTTGGGYLVPTVTQKRLEVIKKAFGGISAEAEHINTSHGAPINWPSIDDTANSAAAAAINAAPSGGGADAAFTQISLKAWKFAATGTGNAALKVPKELVDDALIDVTGMVTQILGIRLGRFASTKYAQGVGTTEPQGLFDKTGDAAAMSVTGGLVQATAVSQLQTAVYALDPAYRDDNCVWVMSNATMGILAGYVDSGNRPLLQPNYQSGLGGSVSDTRLLGYRVVIDQGSPAFSATASANPGAVNESFLAFGNINEAFVIRDVQGIGIAMDPYAGLATNQLYFYGYMRTDSTVKVRAAYILVAGYHS